MAYVPCDRTLRRMAYRNGCYLVKSRKRNWSFDDQGGYMIVDLYGGYVIRGSRFELDAEDVYSYFKDE